MTLQCFKQFATRLKRHQADKVAIRLHGSWLHAHSLEFLEQISELSEMFSAVSLLVVVPLHHLQLREARTAVKSPGCLNL